MLPKLYFDTDNTGREVQLHKFVDAEDVSDLGAFPCGTVIILELTVSRRLGAVGAVLRIRRDGCQSHDVTLEFCRTDNLSDVYYCVIDTAELCGDEGWGLFYYELLLLRGFETLFTDTNNNFDFTLSQKEGRSFSLLVFERDFKTPNSFGRGVMYQIFPDRFFKGESDEAKKVSIRTDVILNPDWEKGVPQFAKKQGDPLENNLFFGGTLWGVAEKLDYLASLGVTFIYLCPVFEAYSNHKYDTADYTKVDEMFGGDEALDNLIEKAREKGIGVILDGVFNHTGDDSVYFNRYKRYGDGGAYNAPESQYRDWYCFKNYPEEYDSWWGIDILPKLDHNNVACRRYFTGENGIIKKYIERGIAGWRLDVADELSNDFLDELRTSAKSTSSEAVIIGEVWENAVEKSAYGQRRRYFGGRQLDSVMNYPLKNAILSFCLWADADALYDTLTEIYSTYPPCVSHKLMNIVGTHDTERILTVLGNDEGEELSNEEKARRRLDKRQREHGIELLKIAAAIQYTACGIPSLYYGDEIGVEGYGDPFCRMPFPWHLVEESWRHDLLEYYAALGRIRREEAFDGGVFYVVRRGMSHLVFVREKNDSRIIVAINRGSEVTVDIPNGSVYRELISGKDYEKSVTVPSDVAMIFKELRAL